MKNYLNAPNKTLSYLLTLVAFASFWFIAGYIPYQQLYPICQTAAECSDPIMFPFHFAYKFFWLCIYLVLALFASSEIQNFSNRVRLGRDQYLKELEVMRLLNEQKTIEAAAIEKNILCTKCKCKSCADQNKNSDGSLLFFIPFLIIFSFIF